MHKCIKHGRFSTSGTCFECSIDKHLQNKGQMSERLIRKAQRISGQLPMDHHDYNNTGE